MVQKYSRQVFSILVVLAAFVFVLGCGSSTVFAADAGIQQEESDLAAAVNESRSRAGVPELEVDKSLSQVAALKAKDMAENYYFSHNSPQYGSLQDMLDNFGLDYESTVQKIARTHQSVPVSRVHEVFMSYSSHKKDILDKDFNCLGMAVAVNGNYKYIVEIFAEKTTGEKPGEEENKEENKEEPEDTQDEGSPDTGSGDAGQDSGSPSEEVRGMNSSEKQLLQLINSEREKKGLQALDTDSKLAGVARAKAQDMVENGYFADNYRFVYNSSTGSLESMLDNAGVEYEKAEQKLIITNNVEYGHNYYMKNSSSYRETVLDRDYTAAGAGVVQGDKYKFVVLVFIKSPGSGTGAQPGDNNGDGQDSEDESEDGDSGDNDTGEDSEDSSDSQAGSGDQTPGNGEQDGSDVEGLTADEQDMLDKVNRERTSRGLHALKPDLELTKVARVKAKDMIDNNYFSHTSPTYGSPFEMMREFGIDYRTAGENIAGAPSVERAHNSLMNSPGHRANILRSEFKEVGIGIVDGGPYGKMFVQMFKG